VRKEDVARIQQFNQSEPAKGALVLDGPTRWLRTLKKVKNPTLNFTVLVGPYRFNNSSAINLYPSPKSNTLKVQVSGDGITWEDIALEDRNIGNPHVNIHERGLDPTSPIFSNANRERLPLNELGLAKPQYTVKINSDQLYLPSDPSSSFYIRIIQETIAIQNRPSWAIYDIDIISREQTTIGQTGLQRSNSYALTSSFSTPNLLSSLEINNAASMAHLSDNLFSFSNNNPKISAFKDTKHIIDDSKEFYQYGVTPKSYPGFESPLSSKKIIEVDLSTQESIDLLRLNDSLASWGHAITGSGDLGSNIMVYWNKDLKRWEKIGWPIGVNDFGGATTAFNIVNILSSSAVGFSSCGVMVTGSGTASEPDTTAELLPNDLLNSYNRPTDTFGFPYSGRYYATGSQYILAKDIGITKPFVFEKAVLDFEMRGRVNYDFGGFDGIYLQNKNYNESTSTPAVRHGTPTFFILRQKKESFDPVKISTFTGSKANETVSYTESLPSFYQLASSSNDLTYVDESRELITYGQHTIIISSSYSYPSNQNFTPNVSFDDFLKSPIVRDNHTVFSTTKHLQLQQAYFTGSFKTEFPCRSTARISPFSPYYVVNTPGGGLLGGSGYSKYANIRMGKQLSGRSSGWMNKEGRSLVNGFSAFTPSNNNITIQYTDTPQTTAASYFTNPVVVAKDDSVDLVSPYIIMPEDKLVFGWQAPLSFRRISADLDTTYITLFGNSKLRLFGSEVKLGTEYHTGLNQNLTTDNIHAVIGDEPVVDQFAVAPREELTGSIYDDFPIDFSNAYVAGTQYLVYGNNIVSEENDVNIVTLADHERWFNGTKPLNRINSPSLSLIGSDISDIFGASAEGAIRLYMRSLQANQNLVDISRVFQDAVIRNIKVIELRVDSTTVYSRPSYGSAQCVLGEGVGSTAKSRLGGSPKYYFNGKHYGYFSDLIRQGLDGTFVDDPTTTLDNIFTESPIRIEFVRSEYNNTTVNREFSRIRPEDIDNTAEQEYQSSNLSLFATSSIPYKDDLVTRNRNYGEYEIVIS
jgi:hypothetical protein